MTTAQAQNALERANEIRIARADFHRSLRSLDDYQAVRDVIENPPAWANTLSVLSLLKWLPRVGEVTARPMMMRAGVAGEHSRVGRLTDRQRRILIEQIRLREAQLRESRKRQR